jgi:hypothetical protein
MKKRMIQEATFIHLVMGCAKMDKPQENKSKTMK